ncbi:glycoprotein precursor [Vinegar Hill virus]|uniref:M polyprotein n=1 Tax=Vinegar Hill virus TaxID=2059308 RepID=A0A2H4X1W2_9VIRU|nr:glycoprotein precursor [Vinegar Hill virus]AUD40047.1 glycoprotein precursor [Vinegar Hill virus]
MLLLLLMLVGLAPDVLANTTATPSTTVITSPSSSPASMTASSTAGTTVAALSVGVHAPTTAVSGVGNKTSLKDTIIVLLNNSLVGRQFQSAIRYITDGTARMELAAKIVKSSFQAGYKAKGMEDSAKELYKSAVEGLSALFLGSKARKKNQSPSKEERMDPRKVFGEGFEGQEELMGTYYKFQVRETTRKDNYTTLIYLDLIRNKTVRFPVTELGYMLGFGRQTSLICNEARPGEDGHNVVDINWVTPYSEEVGCYSHEEVSIEDLNFINLFRSNQDDSGLIVINYLTTYLRFRYRSCDILIEVAGCVMRTVRLDQWAYFDFNNGTHAYPIAHIMINRHVDNEFCQIAFCAITNSAEESISNSKFKGVILNVQPKRATMRHLLSSDTEQQQGVVKHKYRNKCNTKNQLLPYMRSVIHSMNNPLPGEKIAFCNGTKHTKLPLGPLHRCYSVAKVHTHHQCPGLAHNAKTEYKSEDVSCTVDYHTAECETGHYCFRLSMNGSGHYTLRGSNHTSVESCDSSCLVRVPLNENSFTLTCPDGGSHLLRYNLFTHGCPFVKYLGNSAFYICRATMRPSILYAVFFWLFGGRPFTYVVFTLLKYLTLLVAKVIIKLRMMMDRSKGNCEYCSDFVRSGPEWQRHEDCKLGNCPYCRSRLSIVSLKKHVCTCLEREYTLNKDRLTVERRLLPSLLRATGTLLCWLQRTAVKSTWIAVSLILILVLISPVESLHNVDLKPGLWEKEVVEVELCEDKCFISHDMCVCPQGQEASDSADSTGRRLLAINYPIAKGHYGSKAVKVWNNSVGTDVVLDIKTPWGTVNVAKTHKPSYSTSSIRMSWSSEKKDDRGYVILSGKSTSVLRVEKDTGLSWELTSEKSNEKRLLTISILDYSQIYKARFNYLTGDRKIGSWMHGTCSGNCPEKCGCDRSSCTSQIWLKSRNWHCNPTWCWRMDEGCTCCAADIETLYNEWVVTKWSLEFITTEVLVCVDYDHDTRSCDVLNEELTFQAGPYKIQLSEVMSEKFKLPEEVGLFHKVPGDNSQIDLMKVHHITSTRNMCKLQSCTHGSAGDSQIYNLNHFISNDIRSEYFFLQEDKKKVEREHWMSWEGVDLDYHCDSGHWPKCFANGAVLKNSEAFSNLLNVEHDYTNSFFFHTLACRLNGSIPALELQARPKQQAGHINVYVEVDKLRLNPIEAEITELQLIIYECKGCYGCLEGGECAISILMKGAEKIGMHLSSRTDHVTLTESTIMVTAMERHKTTVKFFSAVDVSSICMTVEEVRLCKTCEKDYKVCKSVSLTEPEGILLEHRGSLVTTQKDNCTGKLVCWSGSLTSLFSGLSNLMSYLGGGWFKGLLIFLIPGLAILVCILWGPQLLTLFRVRRFFKRHSRLRTSTLDPEGVLNLERTFTKEKMPKDDLLNLLIKNK